MTTIDKFNARMADLAQKPSVGQALGGPYPDMPDVVDPQELQQKYMLIAKQRADVALQNFSIPEEFREVIEKAVYSGITLAVDAEYRPYGWQGN